MNRDGELEHISESVDDMFTKLGLPDPVVMAWLRGRLDNAFGIVDQHLGTTKYLVGDALSIADFSLSGYLFYPVEESGYDWPARFPNIAVWVERLRALPGWGDPRLGSAAPLNLAGFDPLFWGFLVSGLLSLGVSLRTRPDADLVKKFFPTQEPRT